MPVLFSESPSTSAQSTLSQFAITVNGQELTLEEKGDIMDISVENSLHLPDMMSLRLYDQHLEWINSDRFEPGTRVKVFARHETESEIQRIFSGEVTSLEMDLNNQTTPCVVVRAYDLSHRLQKGRASRSFTRMKDSEIVERLARECSIRPKVESTSESLEYVFQNNQTNWEFLQERARRIGWECFVSDDEILHFRKPRHSEVPLVTVRWGYELRAFRPRINLSRQVTQVTVLGWDPKSKKQIKGVARHPRGLPEVGSPVNGTEAARVLPHSPKMIVVDRPVHTQQEADAMAQSILDELAQDYLTADGLVFGNAGLKAGVQIRIPNLGERFKGEYYVTATTHSWTPHEGYMTSFVIGGRHAHTVTDLLGHGGPGGKSGASVLNPAGGNIVVGIVTNNVDPTGMGRIKVKYPWLVDDHESHWARLSTPMAGPGRGFYWIPEIDDEVLVAFEHGDMHRPYVIGCLWNGKDSPIQRNDSCVQGGKVNRRLIKTRYGHELEFNDTGGAEHIMLKTAGNHVLTINDSPEQNVTLKTTYGHQIKLDDDAKSIAITTPGGHSFSLEDTGKKILAKTTSGHLVNMDDAGGVITVQDNVGDSVILTKGTVNVTALLMMNLQAPVINMTGAVAVNIQGLMVNQTAGTLMNIRGETAVNVNSSNTVEIKGDQKVGVNSDTLVDVKAAKVQLNT